jgi:hypothetical protein
MTRVLKCSEELAPGEVRWRLTRYERTIAVHQERVDRAMETLRVHQIARDAFAEAHGE